MRARIPKVGAGKFLTPGIVIALTAVCALLVVGAVCAADAQGAGEAATEAAEGLRLDLSEYVPRWARSTVLGVAIWQFAAAFIFILLGMVLKKISDVLFEKKIVPILKRTPVAIDHLIAEAASRPVGYLLLLGGFAGALAVLAVSLPKEPNVGGFLFGVLRVLFAADVMWFLFRFVDAGGEYLTKLAVRTESVLDDQLIPLIRKALKVTIGVVGFVWVVQSLGYNVSTLLAGLGIGGLAIALALQDTFANVFGSILIFLDRPFRLGDWIKVGEVEGFVENIGFRSTRVRTLPTTLVCIPNKTVANSVVDNQSRMPKRLVTQIVGVTYDTNADQMEQALAEIRSIIENDEGVDKELIIVRFTEFGDSSLNILTYYFTTGIPLAEHLVTKERVNLAIMRALEQLGLSIAFPSHTVYLEGKVAQTIADRVGTGRTEQRGGGERAGAP